MYMIKSIEPTKTVGRWQWIIVDRSETEDRVVHGGLANSHNQAQADAIKALKKMQK